MKSSRTNLPVLEITSMSIYSVIKNLYDRNSLIISDEYASRYAEKFDNYIIVRDSKCETVETLMKDSQGYNRIIGIGGCTSLDVARACGILKEVYLIPTILSTSCISVDRSVIEYDKKRILKKTTSPKKVIVSLDGLINTTYEELVKWSSSGFGDLLANISAAIDHQFRSNKEKLKYEKLYKLVPYSFDALKYVMKHFKEYDVGTLKRLALYLHYSSLMVIKMNSASLSSAGEHRLYHIMKIKQNYPPHLPTHGQLVTIGTLISSNIYAKETGDDRLYSMLKIAFKKLGLPVTYEELRRINIEKKHILDGLSHMIDEEYYLTKHLKKYDAENILDEIYNA